MSERQYPYAEGDVTVLGPEIFVGRITLANGSEGPVISWQGDNYYPLPMAQLVIAIQECEAIGHDWNVVQEIGADTPSHVICARCSQAHSIIQPAENQDYESPNSSPEIEG